MEQNACIQTQLMHRTIRAFQDKALSEKQIHTLLDVSRHSASSTFNQAYSILGITDQDKKDAIAKICNQDYVATTAHLFIFLLDQNRNRRIAEAKGCTDTSILHTTDKFFTACSDALIAAQNMTNAAEAMGLGCVYLGSIQNDARAMIRLLNLPELTFPFLGLGVGYPDQEPQLKPKLPRSVIYQENNYMEIQNPVEQLAEYDSIVSEYYDLRDTNNRVDTFTNQTVAMMQRDPKKRAELLEVLHEQGFMLR